MNKFFAYVLLLLSTAGLVACGGGGGGGAETTTSQLEKPPTKPPTPQLASLNLTATRSGTGPKATNTLELEGVPIGSTLRDSNLTLQDGMGISYSVTLIATPLTLTVAPPMPFNSTYTVISGAINFVNAPSTSMVGKTFTTGSVFAVITDTGITSSQCYAAASDTLVSCTNASAVALSPTQDGMIGRDVEASNNSDGVLGFSYSSPTAASGDNTKCVKDNITGLVWEGKPTTGTRAGSNTYANYDSTKIDAVGNSVGYKNYVNSIALCGYTDWRLPTADELQSIVNYDVAFPSTSIDTTWFPNTTALLYWASTPSMAYTDVAWYAHFHLGYVINGWRGGGSTGVRLVRGTASMQTAYSYSTDGSEVIDNTTGLTWRRCVEGMVWNGNTCTGSARTYTHEQALAHATSQVTPTKIWRLPNIKELFRLSDKTKLAPTIDTTIFPATAAGIFWSSTPVAGNSSRGWHVNFIDGYAYYNDRIIDSAVKYCQPNGG